MQLEFGPNLLQSKRENALLLLFAVVVCCCYILLLVSRKLERKPAKKRQLSSISGAQSADLPVGLQSCLSHSLFFARSQTQATGSGRKLGQSWAKSQPVRARVEGLRGEERKPFGSQSLDGRSALFVGVFRCGSSGTTTTTTTATSGHETRQLAVVSVDKRGAPRGSKRQTGSSERQARRRTAEKSSQFPPTLSVASLFSLSLF